MKEAAYYKKLPDHRVECLLCPHHCKIPAGRAGICLTRRNSGGMLVSANYCRPVATAVDPIEKKPLFHFYPGAAIFSTGPNGCTFKCAFCQNHEIAQRLLAVQEITPERFVEMVVESGAPAIAYTYSEPTIWFETIMEVGGRLKRLGLKNVMVINGFIEPAPMADLLTVIDAWNIDIKSMNPSFYRRICKGALDPVLAACEQVKRAGSHLEITHLLIPDENDHPAETKLLADFIADRLGADTPLHLSRYFPRHHMNHPPTPEALLDRAWEIAHERLKYVYVGNAPAGNRENTLCPQCGTLLIAREGYSVHLSGKLLPGKAGDHGFPVCTDCGERIPIRLDA
jgi:pyruvate formate lyase activating enzyme